MSRTTFDRASNLTAAEPRRVHVRVGQTGAHGFQGGVEITWVNALADRPRNICGRDRPGDASRSGCWASRLTSAAAQEYHDTTSDSAGCKVQVGHKKRR